MGSSRAPMARLISCPRVAASLTATMSLWRPSTAWALDAWPYGDKSVFVLSTRPLAAAPPRARVERLSGSPAEVHAQLAARGLQHVYDDGGITIQGFLRAGLIQRLIVTRVPVLIGEGISLFGAGGRYIPLKPITTRQYGSGLVQSEYEVGT